MTPAAEFSVAGSARELLEGLDPDRVSYNADVGALCTYRVGGRAAVVVEVSSVSELELVSALVRQSACQALVVGRGSNLLIADGGFDGVVIQLGDAFDSLEIHSSRQPDDGALVTCGAATLLPVAARKTAAAALSGFEWAVGVPGSIGGAVRMNAGGHGSDMAESLLEANVFDLQTGETETWSGARLAFGYRRSALARHHVVLSCVLQLRPGDAEKSKTEISEIVRWRRANQPGGQNAGSVFANPEGDSAGRLIDSLGLKGFRVRTASVSEKHANFIQAEPGGSADDVYALIGELRHRVQEAYGITLRAENILIGFSEAPGLDDADRHCESREPQV